MHVFLKLSILSLSMGMVAGCTTSADARRASAEAPDWFKDWSVKAANKGAPDVASIPPVVSPLEAGEILQVQNPYIQKVTVDFDMHPRAKVYVGSAAEILETKAEILAGGLDESPPMADHLSNADIAYIKKTLDRK